MKEEKKAVDGPTDKDIILGRGSTAKTHPGNVMFRALVSRNKSIYTSRTRRGEKNNVTQHVIDTVTEAGGRFLDQDEDGKWFEVSAKKVFVKVNQALREGQPALRQQMQAAVTSIPSSLQQHHGWNMMHAYAPSSDPRRSTSYQDAFLSVPNMPLPQHASSQLPSHHHIQHISNDRSMNMNMDMNMASQQNLLQREQEHLLLLLQQQQAQQQAQAQMIQNHHVQANQPLHGPHLQYSHMMPQSVTMSNQQRNNLLESQALSARGMLLQSNNGTNDRYHHHQGSASVPVIQPFSGPLSSQQNASLMQNYGLDSTSLSRNIGSRFIASIDRQHRDIGNSASANISLQSNHLGQFPSEQAFASADIALGQHQHGSNDDSTQHRLVEAGTKLPPDPSDNRNQHDVRFATQGEDTGISISNQCISEKSDPSPSSPSETSKSQDVKILASQSSSFKQTIEEDRPISTVEMKSSPAKSDTSPSSTNSSSNSGQASNRISLLSNQSSACRSLEEDKSLCSGSEIRSALSVLSSSIISEISNSRMRRPSTITFGNQEESLDDIYFKDTSEQLRSSVITAGGEPSNSHTFSDDSLTGLMSDSRRMSLDLTLRDEFVLNNALKGIDRRMATDKSTETSALRRSVMSNADKSKDSGQKDLLSGRELLSSMSLINRASLIPSSSILARFSSETSLSFFSGLQEGGKNVDESILESLSDIQKVNMSKKRKRHSTLF